jgi:predicted Zn-dependent peptidase
MFGNKDLRKYKLIILDMYINNLFTKIIREHNGLTYNISGDYTLYNEFGLYEISLDINKKDLKITINLLLKIIEDLKNTFIKKKELNILNTELIGSSMLSIESSMNIANFYASQLLYDKENVLSLSDNIKLYQKCSKKDIKDLCNEIFDYNKLNICILGGNIKEKNLRDIINKSM